MNTVIAAYEQAFRRGFAAGGARVNSIRCVSNGNVMLFTIETSVGNFKQGVPCQLNEDDVQLVYDFAQSAALAKLVERQHG